MKYEFLKADITSIVSLPSEFIDEYMLKANGDYIKVYLFMLRNADRLINPEIIADALELTIKDVERAISYWCKIGILIENEDSRIRTDRKGAVSQDDFEEILLTKNLPSKKELEEAQRILNAASEAFRRGRSAQSTEDTVPESADANAAPLPAQESADIAEKDDKAPEAAAPVKGKKTLPDRGLVDISKLRNDEDFQELVFCVQTYTEKIFSPIDTEKLAYLYDVVGIHKDLLEYVAEMSVQKGKKSINYIERVALSLHEKGITTVEAAKEDNAKFYNENMAVLRAFGIHDRTLAPVESRFVKKWFDNFGFSRELVVEAIGRTLLNTSSQSFSYADGILTSWHKDGVRTMEDVRALDEKHGERKINRGEAVKPAARQGGNTTRFNNFEQRNDDIDSDMQDKFLNELNKL